MSQNQIEDSKKPYETPTLAKLGKVEEVTQGGTPHVADVAMLGSQ